MNKERREDVLAIAVVISIAVHVLLMLGVRSAVMSHALVSRHADRRAPVRVAGRLPRPESTPIEAFEDEAPKANEVPVESLADIFPDKLSQGEKSAVSSPATLRVPEVLDALPPQLEPAPPILDAGRTTDSLVDMPPVMTRLAVGDDLPQPRADLHFSAGVASNLEISHSLPAAPMKTPELHVTLKAPRLVQERIAPKFTPSVEVYDKVDSKVVEQEKNAVRDLMMVNDSIELKPLVDVRMSRTADGEYEYFKVMVSPKWSLPVVPKDLVLILDASGSIGSDRLGSIRKAAKKILRTATNSGDRYNLVAFRDRYSYAFRSWQECTQSAFDASDKWLNNLAAHGRTDVFATISSVLTLPRDPRRPLVALVITDGDANSGISDNVEILSRFAKLNNGLVSVYMYGVCSYANRELIDVLTHGNRGDSFIFDGWRWNAGDGIDGLSRRFRDPVLSDIVVVFGADCRAEAYPRLLKNLYRGEVLSFVGRVSRGVREITFSMAGLGGSSSYESFFRLSIDSATEDRSLIAEWRNEHGLSLKLK